MRKKKHGGDVDIYDVDMLLEGTLPNSHVANIAIDADTYQKRLF